MSDPTTPTPNPAPNPNQPIIVVGGQSVPATQSKALVILFILALAAMAGFGYMKKREYDGMVIKLQNQVAARDQTIESQKNVYEKLTLQFSDMKDALDLQSETSKKLLAEIKKDQAQLLSVQNIAIKLQDQLAHGGAHQEPVEGDKRTKVTFSKDFPIYTVSGYTLTNPAEYELKFTQTKPLKLTMAVAQDEEGEWHSYTTSSDDGVSVEIGIAAVNPRIFDQKWYEKIRFAADLGVGYGILTGIGGSYQFGQYAIGPKVWTTLTTDGIHSFLGASFSWAPFTSK